MKYIKTYEQNNLQDSYRFIEAAKEGDLKVVKELLKRSDIDVNIQNIDGNTALIWASYEGHLDIVKELLKRSDIDLNIKDNDDKDFFDYLKEDQKEVIIKEFPEQYQRYLIRKKASKYNI